MQEKVVCIVAYGWAMGKYHLTIPTTQRNTPFVNWLLGAPDSASKQGCDWLFNTKKELQDALEKLKWNWWEHVPERKEQNGFQYRYLPSEDEFSRIHFHGCAWR